MKLLVGGQMGAGKDTVAAALVHLGFRQFALANRLKIASSLLYPEIMVGSDYNAKREKWQKLGSKCRELDINTFIGALWFGDLKDLPPETDVVISDCRYRNEFEFFTARGFRLLRVEVDHEERMRRLERRDGKRPSQDLLEHPSERDISEAGDIPHLIRLHNNGTVEDIKERVRSLVLAG